MSNTIPVSHYLPTDQRVALSAQYINKIYDYINAEDYYYDVVPLLRSNVDVIWYDSVSGLFEPTTIKIFNSSIWKQASLGPGTVSGWTLGGIAGAFAGADTDESRVFTPSGTPIFGNNNMTTATFELTIEWTIATVDYTATAYLAIPVVDSQAFLDTVDVPTPRFWMPAVEQRISNTVTPSAQFSAVNLSVYPSIHPVSSWRWQVLDDADVEVLPGNDYSLVTGSHLGLPDTECFVKDYVTNGLGYNWSGSQHSEVNGMYLENSETAINMNYAPGQAGFLVNNYATVASEKTTLTYWFKLATGGCTDLTIEVNGDDVVYDQASFVAGWHSVDIDPQYWAAGIKVTFVTGAASTATVEETKFVWAYENVTNKLELAFVSPGNYKLALQSTVPTWTPTALDMTQEFRVSPAYEEILLPQGGVVTRPAFVTLSNGIESQANTNLPLPFDNGRAYVQIDWGKEASDGEVTIIGTTVDPTATSATISRSTRKDGKFGKEVVSNEVSTALNTGKRSTAPATKTVAASTSQLYTLESAKLDGTDYTGQYVYFTNLDTACKIVGYNSDSINIVEVPTSYFGLDATPHTDISFIMSPACERAHVELTWSYEGSDYRRTEVVRRARATSAAIYTRFYNIPAEAEVTGTITPATGMTYAPKKSSAAFTQTFAQPSPPDEDNLSLNGTTYGVLVRFPKITGAAGYLCRAYETWEANEKSEQNLFVEQPVGKWVMIPVNVDNGRAVSISLYTVGTGNILSTEVTSSAMGGSLTLGDVGFTYPCGTIDINNAELASAYRVQLLATADHLKAAVEKTYTLTVHNHDSNIHIKRLKCQVSAIPTDASANVSNGTITGISNYTGTVADTTKITDVAHGLATGDTVAILGTVFLNGNYAITKIDNDNFYINKIYTAGEGTTGTWNQSEVTKGYPLILAVDGIDQFVYVWPEIYGEGYFEFPIDLYVPAKEDIRISLYKDDWYKYPTNTTLDADDNPQFKATVMYDYDRNVTIEASEETPVFRVPIYKTETITAPSAPS